MLKLWVIFTIVFGFIFYALFDFRLLLLSEIIGMILSFAFILLIGWLQSLIEKLKLKLNSWKFPIAQFRSFYIAIMGKIPANIQKEADYQRAVLIAEKVLEHNSVDKKYYERYTSREFLAYCFEEIERNKGSYPATATYEPYDWELTSLTDSMPGISEKKLTGRDKYVYYLEKAIINCRREVENFEQKRETLHKGTNVVYQQGKQHESSAAVHAGIANAIGGPVAGLATAIRVESENIAIRQHNEELYKSLAKAITPALYENADNLENAKEKLSGLILARTKASVRLVDFSNPQDLLTQLKPTATIKSKNGSKVTMTVTLHAIKGLKIYGVIPAAVDGSIIVQLKANGRCVGTATCFFPLHGILDDTVKLSCNCNVNVLSDDYQFEFLPDQLWAIEKLPMS